MQRISIVNPLQNNFPPQNSFDERSAEQLAVGYESLQTRFDSGIQVVERPLITPEAVDPGQFVDKQTEAGFVSIPVKASEIGPLMGRVVLYPNRRERSYQPAVFTEKPITVNGKPQNQLQMTILGQPYVPSVGLSEGMKFALGLKTDTNDPSFGSHTNAGGLEAGHFAPVLIGASSEQYAKVIKKEGDAGTHSIGNDVGGVPEKMISQGLLTGLDVKTIPVDRSRPQALPLYWHPTLESSEGMSVARYYGPTSPIKLMLGSASLALGERVVERVGSLVDDAVRR